MIRTMDGIRVGEVIRELRRKKEVSQEILAEQCGISMQAVSKWENGQSYPDIVFLPMLAEYFEVSIDYLLTGNETGREKVEQIKTDYDAAKSFAYEKDVLYIAQCMNGEILQEDKWMPDKPISVKFQDEFTTLNGDIRIHVLGNANIDGEIVINKVNAGGNVKCGDVEGNVNAGGNVTCEDVEGNVNAGNNVKCEDIEGNAGAGMTITCGDIGGDVKGVNVHCK